MRSRGRHILHAPRPVGPLIRNRNVANPSPPNACVGALSDFPRNLFGIWRNKHCHFDASWRGEKSP